MGHLYRHRDIHGHEHYLPSYRVICADTASFEMVVFKQNPNGVSVPAASAHFFLQFHKEQPPPLIRRQ